LKAKPRSSRGRLDPDPVVLDLLVSLTATAIAGAVKKVGQIALASRRRRPQFALASEPRIDLAPLHAGLDALETYIDEALALVEPGSRRELGGQLLLDRDSIQRYHQIREGLFNQLRLMDGFLENLQHVSIEGGVPQMVSEDLLESADLESSERRAPRRPRRAPLPPEFREQIKFVEKRLRSARTAALAETTFLEIRAVVSALRRMLQYVKSTGPQLSPDQ